MINHIAIVSSAYHLPRVARTVGLESPQVIDENGNVNILGQKHFFLYGIDKEYKRPGIPFDIRGELDAMRNYSSGFQGTKPASIASFVSRNTFLTFFDVRLLQSFNQQLQPLKLRASHEGEQDSEEQENNGDCPRSLSYD